MKKKFTVEKAAEFCWAVIDPKTGQCVEIARTRKSARRIAANKNAEGQVAS